MRQWNTFPNGYKTENNTETISHGLKNMGDTGHQTTMAIAHPGGQRGGFTFVKNYMLHRLPLSNILYVWNQYSAVCVFT